MATGESTFQEQQNKGCEKGAFIAQLRNRREDHVARYGLARD